MSAAASPTSAASCPAARCMLDGACKPDRRTPARTVDAAVDHAAATARRCARAEQVVFTVLAAVMLVLFCLRGACVACEQPVPAPAQAPVYGWPI